MACTPSAYGYWVLTSDGSMHCGGNAGFFGSLGSITLNVKLVDFRPSPTGYGYWLLAADGGVFAFGDAAFYGSAGNLRLTAPTVRIVPTPGGSGRLFAFGDACLLPLIR